MNWMQKLSMRWKYRGQTEIQHDEGTIRDGSEFKPYFEKSYEHIEVVRRGTDLIVNSAADIGVDITSGLPFRPPSNGGMKIKQKQLETTLNFRPNPSEDINSFRRQLFMDLILAGNCFQYFDGRDLYHLPAHLVTVHSDAKKKVSHYELNGRIKYKPDEIIHTRDNAGDSIYTGESRLLSARGTIARMRSMLVFQEQFFKNGAVPGLVLQTPNVLGARLKQKMIAEWVRLYKPNNGGKRPLILDGDLKLNPLSSTNFKELDFESSIDKHDLKILKALGVPPILLDSGNNANIRPNMQLFYDTTVIPLVAAVISSYERFFAYDMEPDVSKVRALRPELRDQAAYLQSLVNSGIITANEARSQLRMEPVDEEGADELRIPANIAGSAANPSEGGRPPAEEES